MQAFDDDSHIIDGFPMEICNFKRAYFLRLFKADADYGYCASKNKTYYGFKGHLLISLNGIITGIVITAANVDEREAALNFEDDIKGLLLGDKGYISAEKKEAFLKKGIILETPLKDNMKDNKPSSVKKTMGNARRLVETVIGQLAERFNIEKIRARDTWHLLSRVFQKGFSSYCWSFY